MSRHHNPRTQAAARRALKPIVEAGTNCWRCKTPILPGQPWDAGHVDDLATGGHQAGETRPEHALRKDCPAGGNRSRGGALGSQLRPAGRRRLAAWLSDSGEVNLFVVSWLMMLAAVVMVVAGYLLDRRPDPVERPEPGRYVNASADVVDPWLAT